MKYGLIIFFLGFLALNNVNAEVMSSGSYLIERDSINFGGGLSTSTNYVSESTAGEVATGESESGSYKLHAGYQQMESVFLSVSVDPVTLSPNIPAAGGGIANGSTTVTVQTDNAAGFQLFIKASSSPALVSGANSFADYTTVGADPDFVFSVPAADSEFGFTPEGADIADVFRDDGVSCNAGASDTSDACWEALQTSNLLIAERFSPTIAGSDVVLKFRAESGAAHVQPAGLYVATSTVTALPL